LYKFLRFFKFKVNVEYKDIDSPLLVYLAWDNKVKAGSFYRAFHGFGQAKFPDGGSVLGSSQFSKLHQLSPKILLDSKVVKIDPKIIISLC